jgi:hypothetical protein
LNGGHTAIAWKTDLRRPMVCHQLRAVAICKTEQRFAYIENNSADTESAMTFKRGVSGRPRALQDFL